jgi:HAD superfamily phosphoserine phosphatase-like hydrolase
VIWLALDVDKTLTKKNISFSFGYYLYRKNKISFFQALFISLCYFLHVVHILTLKKLHEMSFQCIFKNKEKEPFCKYVDDFLQANREGLFRPEVQKMLDAYKKEGATFALLSSSPDFIIEKIAKLLSIKEWYASSYEVDSRGIFFHLKDVLSGDKKAEIVRRKKQEGNFVISVSDSMLDVSFLREGDEAIVVSPSRKLKKEALKNGWRIISP